KRLHAHRGLLLVVSAARLGNAVGPTGRAIRERLVGPPTAPAVDVPTRILTEVGRADNEDLEALRPGLVPSPGTRRDAHCVPLPQLDDLVVELHPATPAHDDIHLLLRLVRVAVRKATVGRDALVAQRGMLQLERL